MFKNIKKALYCAPTIINNNIFGMNKENKNSKIKKINKRKDLKKEGKFRDIRSNYVVKDIFNYIEKRRTLNIIRYNKTLKERIDYSIDTYRKENNRINIKITDESVKKNKRGYLFGHVFYVQPKLRGLVYDYLEEYEKNILKWNFYLKDSRTNEYYEIRRNREYKVVEQLFTKYYNDNKLDIRTDSVFPLHINVMNAYLEILLSNNSNEIFESLKKTLDDQLKKKESKTEQPKTEQPKVGKIKKKNLKERKLQTITLYEINKRTEELKNAALYSIYEYFKSSEGLKKFLNVKDNKKEDNDQEKIFDLQISNVEHDTFLIGETPISIFSHLFSGSNILKNLDLKCKIKVSYDKNPSNKVDLSGMFYECVYLETIEGLENLDIKNVDSITELFKACRNLKKISNIIDWNTSSLVDMSQLFRGCNSIELPKILNWNTDNLKDISWLFSYCENAEYVTDLTKFNLSNVNKIECLFYGCKKLKEVPNIFKHISGNDITSLSNLFNGCEKIEELPKELSDLNTSNVTTINSMFRDCKLLKTVPDLSKWVNVKIENASYMFAGCTSLKMIPGLSSLNLKKIQNLSNLFLGCISMESFPKINEIIDVETEQIGINIHGGRNLLKIFKDCDDEKVKIAFNIDNNDNMNIDNVDNNNNIDNDNMNIDNVDNNNNIDNDNNNNNNIVNNNNMNNNNMNNNIITNDNMAIGNIINSIVNNNNNNINFNNTNFNNSIFYNINYDDMNSGNIDSYDDIFFDDMNKNNQK